MATVAPMDRIVKSALMLGEITVVVVALYLAKGVLVPMSLAVLLEFHAQPGVRLAGAVEAGADPGGAADGDPGLCGVGRGGVDRGEPDDRHGP